MIYSRLAERKGVIGRFIVRSSVRRLLRAVTTIVSRALVPGDWELIRVRIEIECARLATCPQYSPPMVAQRLLVSGEDHRHAGHPGFDVVAICRALWRGFAYGAREGASTIEQQIVRTITARKERTIRRKMREIVLAALVSRSFPKGTIPAVYLAIAYYGWRMNGYRQACQRLKLCPNSLTLEEAAGLIARLKYPEPKIAPIGRRLQIQRRSKHLLCLYRRHIRYGTYRHLNGTTARSRPTTLAPAQPVPES